MTMIKTALKLILAFELCALIFSWLNVRKPWIDPLDGSQRPSPIQVVGMTHLYVLVTVLVFGLFYEVMKRTWSASNRRRR